MSDSTIEIFDDSPEDTTFNEIYKYLNTVRSHPNLNDKINSINRIRDDLKGIIADLKNYEKKFYFDDFYIFLLNNPDYLPIVRKLQTEQLSYWHHHSDHSEYYNYCLNINRNTASEKEKIVILYEKCGKVPVIFYEIIELVRKTTLTCDSRMKLDISEYLKREKVFDLVYELFLSQKKKFTGEFLKTVNFNKDLLEEYSTLKQVIGQREKKFFFEQIYLQKYLNHKTCRYFFEFPKSVNQTIFELKYVEFAEMFSTLNGQVENYTYFFTENFKPVFDFLRKIFNENLYAIFKFLDRQKLFFESFENTTYRFKYDFLKKYIEENYTPQFIEKIKLDFFEKHVPKEILDEYNKNNYMTSKNIFIRKPQSTEYEDQFFHKFIAKEDEEFFERISRFYRYACKDYSIINFILNCKFDFKNIIRQSVEEEILIYNTVIYTIYKNEERNLKTKSNLLKGKLDSTELKKNTRDPLAYQINNLEQINVTLPTNRNDTGSTDSFKEERNTYDSLKEENNKRVKLNIDIEKLTGKSYSNGVNENKIAGGTKLSVNENDKKIKLTDTGKGELHKKTNTIPIVDSTPTHIPTTTTHIPKTDSTPTHIPLTDSTPISKPIIVDSTPTPIPLTGSTLNKTTASTPISKPTIVNSYSIYTATTTNTNIPLKDNTPNTTNDKPTNSTVNSDSNNTTSKTVNSDSNNITSKTVNSDSNNITSKTVNSDSNNTTSRTVNSDSSKLSNDVTIEVFQKNISLFSKSISRTANFKLIYNELPTSAKLIYNTTRISKFITPAKLGMNEQYYRLDILDEKGEKNSTVPIKLRYYNKILPYEYSEYGQVDRFIRENFTEIQNRKYYLLLNNNIVTEKRATELIRSGQVIDIFAEPK